MFLIVLPSHSFLSGYHFYTKPMTTLICSQQPTRIIQLGWKPLPSGLGRMYKNIISLRPLGWFYNLLFPPSWRHENISSGLQHSQNWCLKSYFLYLNGVNIVSNDDKLRFLLLDKGGDGVDTVADGWRPLGGRILLAGGASLSSGLQTSPSVLLRLGSVFFQETEELSG